MKRAFRTVLLFFSWLFISLVLYLNLYLHSGPDLASEEETKADVLLILNSLEEKIKKEELGKQMQTIFPEGYVFTNALYGLSQAEIARITAAGTAGHTKAIKEARFAYVCVSSNYARDHFYYGLKPSYGIYYRGWKNYLLGKILSAQRIKDTAEVKEFKVHCADIAHALRETESPYPESYPEAAWPADVFVAVASLKMHDKLFPPVYDTVIKKWLEKVKLHLDPGTGLVAHEVDALTGETKTGARGESISLILRMLAEIDPAFALEQFKIYHEKFYLVRFGLPCLREYPDGKSGKGDIDSGPVVFGMGFAGTIVSVGTLKTFGECRTASLLSSTIESFGFTTSNADEKEFIFGQLPIADAFIAWSRIAPVNAAILELKDKDEYAYGSVGRFHFYSALLVLFILFLLYRKRLSVLFNKNE